MEPICEDSGILYVGRERGSVHLMRPGLSMRGTISCGVITFNEEKNIRDCLESAKWMDEIVVVDSFSRDKTVEISREYTDRVYQNPWNGYGEQKNFTIERTTADWVFNIDADESITAALREAVERIL